MVPSATAEPIRYRVNPARPRSAVLAGPPREARKLAMFIPPMCPGSGR